jgi:hypothetical protein
VTLQNKIDKLAKDYFHVHTNGIIAANEEHTIGAWIGFLCLELKVLMLFTITYMMSSIFE